MTDHGDRQVPLEQIALVERICGYEFTDKALIEAAITHPSAVEDGHVEHSYERLEFLGDSILGAIIANELYMRFPEMDEGGMTRIKVSVVSGSTLAQVAGDLGITDCIVFGGSETGTGKRGLHSALENVYESIVAALFLDGGLDVARAWVLRTLDAHIDPCLAVEPENPKSALQELLQADRITPTYETIDIDGPPHARIFTSNALAKGTVIGTGKGSSKKQSEAKAALDALEKLAHQRSDAN